MSNSVPGSNINFSFEYAVSIIVVLVVCNALMKKNPNMSTVVIIILGLLVGYLALYVMNKFFPYINQAALSIYQYLEYSMLSNFTSMGYMHVWPPILAVLVVFVVLLYNKNLG
jgi:xanthine/uracil permease